MKKILLFGKTNDVLKDINKSLSELFRVQICELKSDALEGMLKMYDPELVVISLVGAQDYDRGLFRLLAAEYHHIPVLTIGTESEKNSFLRYYEDGQFENLIRPVENRDIIQAVCRRLELEVEEKDDEKLVLKEDDRVKDILVVDDNALTLRSIKEMLRGYYEVRVASSGIKAMTEIGKKRPDLILLDYEMPVCDGKQTFEMIKAEDDLKDIPVIFLTGIKDKAHVEAVLKLKPQGYLLKPPSLNELLDKIEKSIS
ncbi:MAG: response regulator [Lachnospiraceae bacterium]|nr:response regulator [Lachnospiraceae bacterium]